MTAKRKLNALVSAPNECLRGFVSGLLVAVAIFMLCADHPHVWKALIFMLLAIIPLLPIGYHMFSDVQDSSEEKS